MSRSRSRQAHQDEGHDRLARGRQEASAQVGDLLAPLRLLLVGDLREALGEQRVLDAVGAVETPGMGDGLVDEVVLERIARLELGGPLVEAELEVAGLLAGEDQGLGGEAVGDCIETRSGLAGERPGAAGTARVAKIGFDSSGRGGHRRCPVVGSRLEVPRCIFESQVTDPVTPEMPCGVLRALL